MEGRQRPIPQEEESSLNLPSARVEGAKQQQSSESGEKHLCRQAKPGKLVIYMFKIGVAPWQSETLSTYTRDMRF